jgi:hypothetical protein
MPMARPATADRDILPFRTSSGPREEDTVATRLTVADRRKRPGAG